MWVQSRDSDIYIICMQQIANSLSKKRESHRFSQTAILKADVTPPLNQF